MSHDIEDLIRSLPPLDAQPETVERVRVQAHLVLEGRRGVPGRMRAGLARVYDSVLEPVLLAGTAALALAWAVSRILYIAG